MVDLKTVPEDLKQILPYIQRGQEIAKVDPIVSYFCKYYAARLAIASGSTSPESQTYLAALLDQLEMEKSQLSNNESMRDDSAASLHCSTFGLKIFAKADTEDRDGKASKTTARNFIVSSQFLQVIASFGELPEDIAEKVKYAKWRAAEILKAIREGRPVAPVLGAAENGSTNTPSDSELQQQQQPSVASGMSSPLPHTASSPSHVQQVGSNMNTDILGWPSPPSISSPGAGTATAAASGAHPWATNGPSNYPAASSPQPSAHQQPPVQQSYQQHQHQQQFDSLPSVPHSSVYPSNSQQHSAGTRPNAPAGAAAFIPVPASNLPLHMASGNGDASDGELLLNPTDAKSAQKHARWAISALEYDDVATAIENLQKAIQVLAPYRK
ncbi:hypothetical protein GGI25_003413 [Coemansia spiralis]|uniref:DUF605-domain-containing protein n=2 Tax=Coemansia TaxID=4863 RepID=A0A9W8KY24_9FUNG|nr:hypothetical protein EDC05_001671 [Coemansia umbellata]KAJ2621221.1 hypothetical protein GGI26_004294 [Coemansia sp. RSA 1358]KAJ2676768.1 hypothetical protein GGI25_003413 [Coemansia spiralis]